MKIESLPDIIPMVIKVKYDDDSEIEWQHDHIDTWFETYDTTEDGYDEDVDVYYLHCYNDNNVEVEIYFKSYYMTEKFLDFVDDEEKTTEPLELFNFPYINPVLIYEVVSKTLFSEEFIPLPNIDIEINSEAEMEEFIDEYEIVPFIYSYMGELLMDEFKTWTIDTLSVGCSIIFDGEEFVACNKMDELPTDDL